MRACVYSRAAGPDGGRPPHSSAPGAGTGPSPHSQCAEAEGGWTQPPR